MAIAPASLGRKNLISTTMLNKNYANLKNFKIFRIITKNLLDNLKIIEVD
jgi:hypothetical protein